MGPAHKLQHEHRESLEISLGHMDFCIIPRDFYYGWIHVLRLSFHPQFKMGLTWEY